MAIKDLLGDYNERDRSNVMSPELIGILGVGLALAGLLLRMQHHTDKRIDSLSGEMRGLSERVAKLEGLFEGSGLFRSNQPAAGD